MANKKLSSTSDTARPADFDHYAVIYLNDLQILEIREMVSEFDIVQFIDDVTEAGYKISFEFLGKGNCQVGVLQRKASAKDAGIGVSARSINFKQATAALFYKLAIVAQWNLSDVPNTPGASEFR